MKEATNITSAKPSAMSRLPDPFHLSLGASPGLESGSPRGIKSLIRTAGTRLLTALADSEGIIISIDTGSKEYHSAQSALLL